MGGNSNDAQAIVHWSDEGVEWGKVEFVIREIYRDRIPSGSSPWHVAGGDWTFLDCHTIGANPAAFTVGVRTNIHDEKRSIWGEGMIVVDSATEGATLLEKFGRALRTPLPAARESRPLVPLKFNTTILGEGMARSPEGPTKQGEPQGRFHGNHGEWTATKWFLEQDGHDAEVYFNWNPNTLKGEFLEKDPDYRENLLRILAGVFRDGPRPERTPASDGNVIDSGPKFGPGRLLSKNSNILEFSPDGRRALYSTKEPDGQTAIWSLDVDDAGSSRELARIHQVLDHILPLTPDASRCLIVEILPENQGYISSNDPRRLWLADAHQGQAIALDGPWQGSKFRINGPLSPDGRFACLEMWKRRSKSRHGNYAFLYVLDLQTGTSQTVELTDQSLDPIGWIGEGDKLRLAFLNDFRWNKEANLACYLADPTTGESVLAEAAPFPHVSTGVRISPDQTRSAVIDDAGNFIVTDLKTGGAKNFVFHEDDRKLVHPDTLEWVSPRHLSLWLGRLAFIDADAMKLSYPTLKEDNSSGYKFSGDFRWALWRTPKVGVFLAPVESPTRGET